MNRRFLLFLALIVGLVCFGTPPKAAPMSSTKGTHSFRSGLRSQGRLRHVHACRSTSHWKAYPRKPSYCGGKYGWRWKPKGDLIFGIKKVMRSRPDGIQETCFA
jgi:hypothetical protein